MDNIVTLLQRPAKVALLDERVGKKVVKIVLKFPRMCEKNILYLRFFN